VLVRCEATVRAAGWRAAAQAIDLADATVGHLDKYQQTALQHKWFSLSIFCTFLLAAQKTAACNFRRALSTPEPTLLRQPEGDTAHHQLIDIVLHRCVPAGVGGRGVCGAVASLDSCAFGEVVNKQRPWQCPHPRVGRRWHGTGPVLLVAVRWSTLKSSLARAAGNEPSAAGVCSVDGVQVVKHPARPCPRKGCKGIEALTRACH
jgi:hypothetical protein